MTDITPGPALREYDEHPCHDGDVPVSPIVTLADAAIAELKDRLERGSKTIASYMRQVADIREQLDCPPDRHVGLFAKAMRNRADRAEAALAAEKAQALVDWRAEKSAREKAETEVALLKADLAPRYEETAAAAPTCCQCGARLTITSDGPITTRVCPSGCDIVARVARREEREG